MLRHISKKMFFYDIQQSFSIGALYLFLVVFMHLFGNTKDNSNAHAPDF